MRRITLAFILCAFCFHTGACSTKSAQKKTAPETALPQSNIPENASKEKATEKNAAQGTTAQEKTGPEEEPIEKEIKDLQAVHEAWQRNDAEFRAMREQNPSATTEIREFAAYVAELKRQVLEKCEDVRARGEDPKQHGVDCTKLTQQPGSGTATATPSKLPGRPTTDEEKQAALEQQLKDMMGDFDEMITSEQEALKEKQRASSGGAAGTAGAGQPGDIDQGTEAQPGWQGAGVEGELAGHEPEPGSGPGAGKQDVPEYKRDDVGDGSDDDIVARQLREAAEAETDPVLKEQLWEEYRKYKNSTK
jgi:hypothetical protein